jgi:amino acid adenylation domain-containing protein
VNANQLSDEAAEMEELLALLLEEEEGEGAHALSVIGKRDGACDAPLSFSQQRLWFLTQLDPSCFLYNIPRAIRLSGGLDINALERALGLIVSRHESLRTSFVVRDDGPVQNVVPARALSLTVRDLSDMPSAEREAEVRRLVAEEARSPFDLQQPPLLRAGLIRLAADEHVLLLTTHHIASDGWSSGVLWGELSALYNALREGREASLPELKLQYADYAVWQRGRLQGELLEAQLSYWREQLAAAPQLLELPTDRARPAASSYRGAALRFSLPAELSERLRELARREGVTLYMLLFAAWQTLLTRYTGQEDIVVGSPVAGRTRAETEGLIGFFVNTLVLRTDLSGDPTFRELLGRVREVCLGAYAHQEVPFEKVVEELAPERHLNRNPLFQVMFTMQNAPREELTLGGLRIDHLETESGTAPYDLKLWIQDGDGALSGALQYKTELFDEETIERMIGSFKQLMQGVVNDSDRRLSLLPLLDETERRRVLSEWNDTRSDYTRACVHQLFERQAAETPDAVAVICEEAELTYAELNSRANQLARHLRRLGVGPESRVGVLMNRGAWMVVSLLGVLKAGGAYVPLDPEYPRERLSFMLEDAGVGVLLTEQSLSETVPVHVGHVVSVDADWEVFARESATPSESNAEPGNTAYVIYTSGSTGRPKGVLIPHEAILNRLLWGQEVYPLTCEDRVLQKASFSFDFSVWEIFGTLLAGAQLVLARPGGQQDSGYLAKLIAERRVTVAHFAPAMLQMFLGESGLDACESLRLVFSGGEALSVEVQERFFKRLPSELINQYGPTEASVDATYFICRRESHRGTVPIGRPIANTRTYVLDARMSPAPVGVTGELYIAGTGLARGYLGRPSLTAERFIPDPFSTDAGARLYRTGDVVRWLADGELEFIGRADNQVKVRGYRVELGEIEAALAAYDSVRDCIVLAREDEPGDKRLVAYVVTANDAPALSAAECRAHLKERLPEYMVPSAFVTLEALPINANGKVDRRALPAPDSSLVSDIYVAPRDAVEEMIAEVWAEVLRVERVGVEDNFFESGGHSLLAMQVVSHLRQLMGCELPLRLMFEEPTVAGLAAALSRDPESRESALRAAQMLARLSSLSEEEVESMLGERQMAAEGETR